MVVPIELKTYYRYYSKIYKDMHYNPNSDLTSMRISWHLSQSNCVYTFGMGKLKLSINNNLQNSKHMYNYS